MAEVAAATAAPASTGAGAPPPAAPSTTASAGATLTSVPAGASAGGEKPWFSDFKNEETKAFIVDRKFTGPEQLAERYKNLESLRGVPEDRLLKLPEKMEGPEARAIWERLGAPKDMNGYEFVEDKAADPQFVSWAKEEFYKNNLTKDQGQNLVKAYNEKMVKSLGEQAEARKNAMLQSDSKLKKEWGAEYDTNVTLAKQGAKILGLDARTLDVLEAMQGREALFKKLRGIGVGVSESTFVNGQASPAATQMTPEQAQAEIKNLQNDAKFVKKVLRGDVEARAKWDHLNKLAAPGEKSIG